MQNGMVAGGKGLSAWGRKYCDEGVGEKIEKGKGKSEEIEKKGSVNYLNAQFITKSFKCN